MAKAKSSSFESGVFSGSTEKVWDFDWSLFQSCRLSKITTSAISDREIGARVQEKTQLSAATVNAFLRELEKLGIVREVTGQKLNRLYSYAGYIQIMNQGTELPT